MGLLGGLFGAKGTVEGALSLQNKPSGRQILFVSVTFFPVADGNARPPFPLPVDDAARNQVPAASVEQDGRFSVALAPGWYFPLAAWVRFVIEGRQMILDSETPDQAWGLAKPIEVRKGETRHVSLKPDFNEFLRAIGVSPEEAAAKVRASAPFVQRIGPILVREYERVSGLANANQIDAALAGYAAILANPAVQRLPPGDQAELRIVMECGRAKCLTQLGRQNEAAALVRGLGSVSEVIAASADPITGWDYCYTAALVFAACNSWAELRAVLAPALGALAPYIQDERSREEAVGRIIDVWAPAFRAMAEAGQGPALLDAALEAQQGAASVPGANALGFLATCAKIEGLARSGNVAEAQSVAKKLTDMMREAKWSAQAIQGLMDIPRNAGLTEAARHLAAGRR